ncbi:MAG: 2-C-methyl-D-erythritol 4-phosphate cytidylyltransferase [Lachnospiraceae bacterium]|nr:2-C-methyl-D-erythritol 4-phosphate cytidylyltransferase [Lachnospiraceae bacterium]
MCIAILLAGGTGSRVGTEIPKQYQLVNGRPLIAYSIDTLAVHPLISGLWIVAEEDYEPILYKITSAYPGRLMGFSRPGKTRQLSIRNAVFDLCSHCKDDDRILIHDSARPCVTPELITQCIEALGQHDGVMPVLPVTDTVYLSEDGSTISSLLDRNHLYAGQAPELFRLKAYADAMRQLSEEDLLAIHGSTEPAVMAGLDIALIPGDIGNYKITTPEDLERFRSMADRQINSFANINERKKAHQ